MNERHIIEERLRKKEQEVQQLEEKIRAGRIYMQALQDVLRLMASPKEAVVHAETAIRPGSLVAKAREAIFAHKSPMHITDLLKALGLEQSRENRASLTSSLSAYVRRQEVFTRPSPGTFGLVELDHHTTDSESDEPPQGFGTFAQTDSVSGNDLDEEIPF